MSIYNLKMDCMYSPHFINSVHTDPWSDDFLVVFLIHIGIPSLLKLSEVLCYLISTRDDHIIYLNFILLFLELVNFSFRKQSLWLWKINQESPVTTPTILNRIVGQYDGIGDYHLPYLSWQFPPIWGATRFWNNTSKGVFKLLLLLVHHFVFILDSCVISTDVIAWYF